ncbi:hypothetical protein DID80_00380 [Candidatus Marinamargulisbacteria bacterium SCGC AAA071-K20]|nr:hypothetical protein DID80_00380 [Candidatus Marinamargulisbacteria bacterium SCGC AAA071-K20]
MIWTVNSFIQKFVTLIIGFLFCFIIAVTLFYQSNIPQDFIKSLIEYELKKTFPAQITIKKIQGNLLSSIELIDVTIKNPESYENDYLLSIKTLRINYNILYFLGRKGGILNSVNGITINSPVLYLERDKKGIFNTNKLGKQVKKGKKKSPLDYFDGKIHIQNLTIYYSDKKGWNKQLKHEPFYETFKQLNGEARVKNNRYEFDLIGQISSTMAPIKLNGNYNPKLNLYLLNYTFLKVHSNSWGQYIVPLEGFAFLNDTFSIYGNLRSKHKLDKEKLPFWYNVYIKTNNTTLKTPFLDDPLFNTKGVIHIYNATLTKSELKKRLPKRNKKQTEKIYKELQQRGIITKQGYLSNIISKKVTTRPEKSQKGWLASLLKTPPHNIDFDHVKSEYKYSDFFFKGTLSILRKDLDLNFTITNTPLDLLFKEQKHIKGNAKGTLRLRGPLNNPRFSGVLRSKSIDVWGIPIKDTKVRYYGKFDKVNYTVKKAKVYNAPTTGSGTLSLGKNAYFKGQYFTNNIHLKKVPELSDATIKGTSIITTEIEVYGDSVAINLSSSSNNLIIEKQLINNLEINVDIKQDIISNLTATANINDSTTPIFLSGKEVDNTIHLTASANQVLFTDLSEKESESLKGFISFNSELTFPKSISIPKMANNSDITASVFLKNYHFYDQPFETISFKVKKEKDLIKIKNFDAKADKQELSFKGQLKNNIPINLSVTISNLELKKARWFTTFIPQTLWPLDGKLSLQAEISQKNQSTSLDRSNFVARGNIKIQKAIVRNQPFESVSMAMNWDGSTLIIKEALLTQEQSYLQFSGLIAEDGTVDINVHKDTFIQLEEFNPILAGIGHFQGSMRLNGFIKSNLEKPHLNLKFEGNNLAANYTHLDQIKGHLILKNNILTLHNLQLKEALSKISVKGNINGQKGWSLDNTDYDLKFDINQANIHTLLTLFDQIHNDLNTLSGIHSDVSPEKIPNSNIKSSRSKTFKIAISTNKNKRQILYSASKKNTILNQFQLVKDKSIIVQNTGLIKSVKDLRGIVTGQFSVSSRKNVLPILEGHLSIKNSKFLFLKSNKIDINITPKGKELFYNIGLNNGYFGQSKFEKIDWVGKIDSRHILHINKTEISTKKNSKVNLVKGQIPLEPLFNKSINDAPINLEIHLKDDQITALSIFHNKIDSISNKGLIHLTVNGTLKKPLLNSRSFNLEKTRISLNNNNRITIPKSNLKIKNNIITLDKTLVDWEQQTNSQKIIGNGLITSGTIKINELNLLNPDLFKLFIDLTFAKNTLNIYNQNIYIGDLIIENISLKGDVNLPLSKQARLNFLEDIKNGTEKGPSLKGTVKLNNGTLLIPKETVILPAVNMDLDLILLKDLFINGSILGEGTFAGLTTDFELEKSDQSLKISGSLNNPKIENKIGLKDGSLNILNNEFILLKLNEQKNYVALSQSQQQKNTLEFTNKQTINKASEIVAKVTISALAIVEQIDENDITSSENILVESTYSHIFIQINQPIQDIDVLYFDIFESKYDYINPPDLSWKSRYTLNIGSDQNLLDQSDNFELLTLLMPELKQDDTASSELLAKFGEKRVNLLVRRGFLRPLEKQLAKSIGLYDLKIDYNLGSELLQTNTSQTNFLGLNLMQQLVANQLYLKIRTTVDLDSSNQESQDVEISEIELQYYLLKNLSINYANLKDPFTQNSYRPKLSLRFNHEF